MTEFFNIPAALRLGLHALLLLAANRQQRLTVAQLAEMLGVSGAHLAKVIARLQDAGLVAGRTGPAGGYWLARSPERITLLAVYETLEGKLNLERCPFAIPVCNGNGCPLGPFFCRINRQIGRRLKEVTLADIKINPGGKNDKEKKKNYLH